MWPFRKRTRNRSQDPWDDLALQAERGGTRYVVEAGDGFRLARYERNGRFDYETYRSIQKAGNRAKINKVFAAEGFIKLIAADAVDRLGEVSRVLCHGTRNGAEQRWFKDALGGAEVLGTEISETASQFPMTIEWDFHDLKDEWEGYWDVLYSNSWDHSFSPTKMFGTWRRSLRPGGLMYLEHTEAHEIVDRLDLYGATPAALRQEVEEKGFVFAEALSSPRLPDGGYFRQALVFRCDRDGRAKTQPNKCDTEWPR
jgi:hypothetical protein